MVGISILSGAHMRLIPRLAGALREQGQDDVTLLVGGTIPDKDVQPLLDSGVASVFPVGPFTTTIVEHVRSKGKIPSR